MKGFVRIAAILTLLLIPAVISARHIGRQHSRLGHHHPTRPSTRDTMARPDFYRERRSTKHKRPDTLQIAGSSLPDCSHGCGSCSPCRLVMVSFVCASLEEAETCPIAYKCMCNNKSYPVP
ncbi:protein EPIDERMAL PATTERNING FACTOR 1-like [Cornus florida]|uniref:protein EPIDERMAL PATTERNING FACTOR 1-like n=1 Tax=Cornus florida TaxID=4283 RepID=UPI002896A249|nr:protein EPIDERMAL PATTERNING FACTOR 1-like [Cornus florida]